MSRIQPVLPSTATGLPAEHLAATKKLFGSTPNLFTTAAQSPATLAAMNGFFASLGKAPLGGKVGEQVAIAVAQANGCEYCLSAHTAIGGMHGVSAANLASARHGHSDDPKTQAAITLALEIVRTGVAWTRRLRLLARLGSLTATSWRWWATSPSTFSPTI
jgi:AhpD family alkylhydroperoxidase